MRGSRCVVFRNRANEMDREYADVRGLAVVPGGALRGTGGRQMQLGLNDNAGGVIMCVL